MLSRVAGALCALVLSLSAFAKAPPEQVVKADTPEKFAVVIAHVEDEMKEGGRYEFINPTGRQEVETNLASMMDMIKAAGSVDAMSHDKQVQLFNLQEKVNGVLANNASDRLVCTNAAPTGSHISSTQCKTYGAIAADKRALQSKLRQSDGRVMGASGDWEKRNNPLTGHTGP